MLNRFAGKNHSKSTGRDAGHTGVTMSAMRQMMFALTMVSLAACTQGGGKPAADTQAAATPAAASTPEVAAIATTRQIMLGITAPTSDVLFQIGEKPPADDAAWEKVQASALSLAESANLLRIGTRRVDTQEWEKYIQALISSAQVAAQAAQEKNADKVLDAGNQIYETCDGCHQKYMAARGGV